MDATELAQKYHNLDDAQKESFRVAVELRQAADATPVPPPPQDVVVPLQHLMQGVSIMGDPAKASESDGLAGTFRGSPAAAAAVESTATSLAKWWSTAVGAGGALAGVFAAWRAAATGFWTTATPSEHVAVIVAIALCLLAVASSVAVMVSADVRARAVASAAQYEARAAIASAYLSAATRSPATSSAEKIAVAGIIAAAKAMGKHAYVYKDNSKISIEECTLEDGHVEVRRSRTSQWFPLPSDPTFSIN